MSDCIEDQIGKEWEGNKAPWPSFNKLMVNQRTVNININSATQPTGMYDTQGCCTTHKAPCKNLGGCEEKD